MLLFIILAVWKRDSIALKIKKVAIRFNGTQPAEKTLLAFNNEPLECINGAVLLEDNFRIFYEEEDAFFKGGKNSKTVLFMGNSLTYCGLSKEDKEDPNADHRKRGLTSSSLEKDFVHVLLKLLGSDCQEDVRYSVTNIAEFERGFADPSLYNFENPSDDRAIQNQIDVWLSACLACNGGLTPDLVIIQIGENMTKEDVLLSGGEVLKTQYKRLIERFSSSKVVITLPFWPDKEKINIFTEIALEECLLGHDVRIADISHLGSDSLGGSDERNFSRYERVKVRGLKDYQNPGVGAHPGDTGMKRIAECIFTVSR